MQGAANPHCIGTAIKHPFLDLAIAIASTTHSDRHGERLDKSSLGAFCASINKRYYPLLFNHNTHIPPLGCIVAAKLFKMTDGEDALATIMVFFTNKYAEHRFVPGRRNADSALYSRAIDTDMLQALHNKKMARYEHQELDVEEALEAYFESHVAQASGLVRVDKHFIVVAAGFRIHIYPRDHRPAHFHAISKQRNIDARFNIETLELISAKKGKLTNADAKNIKSFFRANKHYWQKMKDEARRLSLGVI